VIYQSDVIAWVESRAKSGYQVIIVDPVSLAERRDEPYKVDGQMMKHLRDIAKEHHAAIFLVTHPTKQIMGLPDLAQISGGAAIGRTCDCALWLEKHDEDKTSTITSDCGSVNENHNRSLWILKTKDGSGTGLRIACEFEGSSLLLKEIGLIVKSKKSKGE